VSGAISMAITRRQLLKAGAVTGAGVLLPWHMAGSAGSKSTPGADQHADGQQAALRHEPGKGAA
jgi:hypothetical protein